jgi:hypothetical protein
MGTVPALKEPGFRLPLIVTLMANGLSTDKIITEYLRLTTGACTLAGAMRHARWMSASFRSGSAREVTA